MYETECILVVFNLMVTPYYAACAANSFPSRNIDGDHVRGDFAENVYYYSILEYTREY